MKSTGVGLIVNWMNPIGLFLVWFVGWMIVFTFGLPFIFDDDKKSNKELLRITITASSIAALITTALILDSGSGFK